MKVLILLFVLAVLLSCTGSPTSQPQVVNNPPVIKSISADTLFTQPGGLINLLCDAEDPEYDNLTFGWLPSAGNIIGTSDSVSWVAPLDFGKYSIVCEVQDSYLNKVSGVINLTVIDSLILPVRISLISDQDVYLVDENIQITCFIENAVNIFACSMNIRYDSSVVTAPDNFAVGDFWGGLYTFSFANNINDLFSVSAGLQQTTDFDGITSSGAVFTFCLTGIQQSQTNLYLENVVLLDESGEEIETNLIINNCSFYIQN